MHQKQGATKQFLTISFVTAYILSFVWEMLQMPFYKAFMQYTVQAWLFCGLASIFDALYIVILYWVGKRFTHNQDWIVHLNWKRILAIALLAVLTATISERVALALGLWQYSEKMAIVPLLQIGIIPPLQLTVLPIITFWLMNRVIKS